MINGFTGDFRIKKLLAITLLFLMVSCSRRNEELQEKVDDKIAELDSAIALSSVKISVEPIPEDELSTDITAFKDRSNYKPSFFDSLKIETTNRFPNSFFFINYDEFKLVRLLGFDNFYFNNNPDRKPKFEIQKVIYADGTNESASTVILNKSDAKKMPYFENDKMINSELYFFQKNSRPIVGVEAKVIANFTNTKDYYLEKGQKIIKTDKGDIEIIEFNNNEFTFKVPATLAEKIEINALYKNGKYLTTKGSQSFEFTPQIKLLEELKKAKDKISEGKINSENELRKFLESESMQSSSKSNEFVTKSIYFSATISKIIVSIAQKDKSVESLHAYFIPKFKLDRYSETGYAICEDAKTAKKGIIDWNGKWLVKPVYHDISQQNFVKNYVQVALNENEFANALYWVDKKNRRLVKPNYELNSYTLQRDHPRLVIVGKPIRQADGGTIDQLGVADTETGKLIVPLEYDQITFSDQTIICKRPNQKGIKIFNEKGTFISAQQKK
ncbi:WG repeat-containing protein [Pedobacter sp. UBA5917]|jgi:hypothetical protein|uniref:WG repeat-containing protein n=1 Tax=Pedobacter sp. UBA5917 TaxID=1947061 RepID=UPI0025D37E5B|nr:WG repeat-containing protein [Pedobacter sp. UBA5917]